MENKIIKCPMCNCEVAEVLLDRIDKETGKKIRGIGLICGGCKQVFKGDEFELKNNILIKK